MAGLIGLSRLIDAVNQFIGKQVSWLVLVAVLVSAYNATIRFVGDGLPAYLPIPRASNSLLELQWYLYGTVFMLASAYTLQRNEHIRIDIVSNMFSKRTRDWIDLFCHIVFLLPFVSLIVWLSWPWFMRSFVSGEISANASGLTIWPAKFMVLAGFILLTAQAFSEIIKRYAVLQNLIDEPTPQHATHPAAEAAIEMEEKRDD